jgi:signal transduction histidine kinase
MPPSSLPQRFDQIDLIATRASSLVTVLILHYTTPDRHSELGDTQLVDVLELIEESLDQVRQHARELGSASEA